MTYRIAITGKNFATPKNCDLRELSEAVYMQNRHIGLIWHLMGNDPDAWAEKIIRRGLPKRAGEDADRNSIAFANATSYLNLHKNSLEIFLNKGDRKPQSLGKGLDFGLHRYEERKPRMLIVRGDIGSNSAHMEQNVSLYIDGNVDQMAAPENGLVYVRGDVKKLVGMRKESNGMVIVAGKIGEIEPVDHLDSDVNRRYDNTQIMRPLPFFITSEQYDIKGGCYEGPELWEAIVRRSYTVDAKRLQSITPQTLLKDAQKLMIEQYLHNQETFAHLADPTNPAAFARKLFYEEAVKKPLPRKKYA